MLTIKPCDFHLPPDNRRQKTMMKMRSMEWPLRLLVCPAWPLYQLFAPLPFPPELANIFWILVHLIIDGCDRQWRDGGRRRESLSIHLNHFNFHWEASNLCVSVVLEFQRIFTSSGRHTTCLLIGSFLQVCSIISSTKFVLFLLGSWVSPMVYLWSDQIMFQNAEKCYDGKTLCVLKQQNIHWLKKCDSTNLHRVLKVIQTFFNVIHNVFIFPKFESCVTSVESFSSRSSFLLQKHHVCWNR